MDDIGPQLPPHLLAKRKRQKEEEEAAAATLAAQSETNDDSKEREGTPEKRRRTMGPIGPAMPPAPPDEMPSRGDDDDDSSSGDDIGPSLPGGNDSDEELAAQRRLEAYERREKEASSKPQRDEWMVVPPKQEEWSQKVDPTKIRARKFQSGKGARAPTAKGGDNALWTESPMEKAKRLEDEIMGVKRPATQAETEMDKKSRREKEAAEQTSRKIEEYNAKNRNKSLYDSHQTSKHKKEEDDPSKRPFDREKDIVGSGKSIGLKQKQDMLKRASDFGSRFSSGSYL